jgi:hypothetical protein
LCTASIPCGRSYLSVVAPDVDSDCMWS